MAAELPGFVTEQQRAISPASGLFVNAISPAEDPQGKTSCRELSVVAALSKPLNKKLLLG